VARSARPAAHRRLLRLGTRGSFASRGPQPRDQGAELRDQSGASSTAATRTPRRRWRSSA
jgi:hypothetical protein